MVKRDNTFSFLPQISNLFLNATRNYLIGYRFGTNGPFYREVFFSCLPAEFLEGLTFNGGSLSQKITSKSQTETRPLYNFSWS